jgi:DNA sulfur modification protein DndB
VQEKRTSGYYRQPKHNHLLFRPAGQLAFARAVQYLLAKKVTLPAAVAQLYSENEMYLNKKVWHHILWDPVGEKMLNNWSPAETLLLTQGSRT